jgi:8-oxo-dGTP pyrophosphatase MutT (NUDIX family)
MPIPLTRRAVRVICLETSDRFLLLHWRDPHDGHLIWEPPGGGLEPGESEVVAAGRELFEETGIVAELDPSWSIEVERDFSWAGYRFAGPERFFAARFPDLPEFRPGALTDSESTTLLGHGWFRTDELAGLSPLLQPPELAQVVADLLAAEPQAAG